MALEKLRIELTGSAEEVAKLRAEQEKEARVELMRRQVARRMLFQGLANGWAAWFELYSAKTYAMNRLKEAANRLRKPDVAGAFAIWVRQWFAKHKGQLETDAFNKGSLVSEQANKVSRDRVTVLLTPCHSPPCHLHRHHPRPFLRLVPTNSP